ncbi:hypothetical protein SteCoe_11209 [Stentor coeruleus]|uniref:Rhodanese domain-containing protein n=1 Tax=Stentor coeruleus TaxID=5963 RepID=A0A1R2CDT3_9CILI|nr:hypothetical protein SteCoe_11209 [Stentor coeruleus]
MFFQSLRTLVLPPDKFIVCYDYSGYIDSSKAYWGLTSIGFKVQILIFKPQLMPILQVISGRPPMINFERKLFRNINHNILTSKRMILEANKKFEMIKINFLTFDIVDDMGKLISKENIIEYLASSGVPIPINKTVLYGKKSFVAALLIKHAVGCELMVMADNYNDVEFRSLNHKMIESGEFYNTNQQGHEIKTFYETMIATSFGNNSKSSNIEIRSNVGCRKCSIF